MLAQIFNETGRFPHEVMELPPGERAFIYAAVMVRAEENAKVR